MNHQGCALGRRSPRPKSLVAGVHFHDLAAFLDPAIVAPEAVDETPGARVYLGHNNQLGTCGVVGLANYLSTVATREGRPATEFSDDAIRDYYLAYTHGADVGVVLLEFLNFAKSNGFFGEPLGAIVAIDPKNWEHVKLGMAIADALYVGAELPLSAQASNFWRAGTTQRDLPGSWGGHCMAATGYLLAGSYGEANVSFDSWAQRFYATRSWWDACVDEVYAVIDLRRETIPGLHLDALRAAEAQLAALAD